MAATIVRQRKLRTGDLQFTATTASDVDQYLVVVSERCDKVKVAELFVAYTPSGGDPNPVPKGTLKQLGTGYLICDNISVAPASAKASLVFKVDVSWKELESSEPPQPQSQPTPNSDSTDPEDWSPTWSRRTNVIFEESDTIDLFYKSGYTGEAHAALSASPTVRKLFQTSNRVAVKNPPARRRVVDVWNFRWLRPTLPSSLVAADGKINSAVFTLNLGIGYAFAWAAQTALISLELSSYKWGNQKLVEISVEVSVDPEGWTLKHLDQGFYVKDAYVGAAWKYKMVSDDTGKPRVQPVRLDGDGNKLPEASAPIYGIWSDYEEVAFNSVALITDLGS